MNSRLPAATIGIALAAASAGAGAVALNPRGLGQVLVYPYYTVNKGQDTLISVVNVSDLGKVVRVRFHEGYNGREVSSFLVFLSPHDVWTAGVSAPDHAETGGAVLTTRDHSCTLPAIPPGGLAFSSANYASDPPTPSISDGGPQTIERTREGHVEIVTDGDILPDSPTERLVRHVQAGTPGEGTPEGCEQLELPAVWADLVAPANTLAGAAGIVDVGGGTYYPYNADALSDFTQIPLVDNVGTLGYDDLSQANSTPGGAVAASVFTDRGLATLDYERGIDAVSAVFMAESIHNEVQLDAALQAATDWILTFPTKRFYVDPALEPEAPRPPFPNAFEAPGESVLEIGYALYDTEELHVSDPCGQICGTPIAPPPPRIPYEVNVIGFHRAEEGDQATTSGVFGSRLVRNLIPTLPDWQSGWARLNLAYAEEYELPGGMMNGVRVTLPGLPVTGFMAYNIVNAQAQPGKLANYSGVFAHRTSSTCRFEDNLPEPVLCPL